MSLADVLKFSTMEYVRYRPLPSGFRHIRVREESIRGGDPMKAGGTRWIHRLYCSCGVILESTLMLESIPARTDVMQQWFSKEHCEG